MKTLRLLPIIFSAAVLLCGCEKGEEAQVVSEVFFSDNNPSAITVAKGSPVIVELQRTNPEETIDVVIGIAKNENDMFVIPETVEFPAGKEFIRLEIPFKGESADEAYTMELKLRSNRSDKSYMAFGSLSVKVSVTPEAVEVLTITGPEVNKIYPGQTLDFTIARENAAGTLTVPFSVENNDANVFGLPSEISFADGEREKTFAVTVSPNAVFKTRYGFRIAVKDGVNKYVNSGNDDFSFEWTKPVMDGYVTLSFSYEGMSYLEPGASAKINITIGEALDEAAIIPLVAADGHSDMFIVPETVSIAAGATTGSFNVRFKPETPVGADYKMAIKAGQTENYIFTAENSIESPLFEKTLTATLSVIQAKFDTTTPGSIVPGSYGYLGVSILAARDHDVVVPLVMDNDGSGMFSIPATVTIPAGTLSGFFPVYVSPSAVRGTTYKIGFSIGESSEYNFIKENGTSLTDRPSVANKSMKVTADWVPYGKCTVVSSGFMADKGYAGGYEIEMLHNPVTDQYKFAAIYMKGGDMTFTWDTATGDVSPVGAAHTIPDGNIASARWLNGWGFTMACTPFDPAKFYYTSATKTFTIENYYLDAMSGAAFGWFKDEVRLVEVY